MFVITLTNHDCPLPYRTLAADTITKMTVTVQESVENLSPFKQFLRFYSLHICIQ